MVSKCLFRIILGLCFCSYYLETRYIFERESCVHDGICKTQSTTRWPYIVLISDFKSDIEYDFEIFQNKSDFIDSIIKIPFLNDLIFHFKISVFE